MSATSVAARPDSDEIGLNPGNLLLLLAHEEAEGRGMLRHVPVGSPQGTKLLGLAATQGGNLGFELVDAVFAGRRTLHLSRYDAMAIRNLTSSSGEVVARESPASDARRAIVNVAWTSPLPISREMAASMDETAAALIGSVILVILRGGARMLIWIKDGLTGSYKILN